MYSLTLGATAQVRNYKASTGIKYNTKTIQIHKNIEQNNNNFKKYYQVKSEYHQQRCYIAKMRPGY
jgi:hypothetical protein